MEPSVNTKILSWRVSPLIFAGLCLVGIILILSVHGFRLSTSVVFLSMGWVSILGAGTLLWHSGLLIAAGEDVNDSSFELKSSRIQELTVEKNALLKAIKEIEFDHLMGKLSDADARQITNVYRNRAIVILKELDQVESEDESNNKPSGAGLSVSERIERDLRARTELANVDRKVVAKVAAIAQRRKAKTKTKTKTKANAKAMVNKRTVSASAGIGISEAGPKVLEEE